MNLTMNSRPLNTLLTLDNPVFGSFVFWSSVLIIKMLLMSLLTALQRFRFKILAILPKSIQKTFISPEDEVFARKHQVQPNDPHVERARRAHRNDMENILPFLTMGLLFITTDPNETLAMILFRIHAIARLIHTLVYAFGPVPQPSRVIAFFVAFAVTIFMGLYSIVTTIKYI